MRGKRQDTWSHCELVQIANLPGLFLFSSLRTALPMQDGITAAALIAASYSELEKGMGLGPE